MSYVTFSEAVAGFPHQSSALTEKVYCPSRFDPVSIVFSSIAFTRSLSSSGISAAKISPLLSLITVPDSFVIAQVIFRSPEYSFSGSSEAVTLNVWLFATTSLLSHVSVIEGFLFSTIRGFVSIGSDSLLFISFAQSLMRPFLSALTLNSTDSSPSKASSSSGSGSPTLLII